MGILLCLGSSPGDDMIPIRFQGCKMGIFGLKSWDPPRQLHEPPPGLSPYILSKQSGIPMSSKGRSSFQIALLFVMGLIEGMPL